MTFCEELIRDHMDIWLQSAELPFVRDMIAGTLDRQRFARYLVQDTQYLSAFAKIYAWSFCKTDDLELMQELYGQMGIIVAGETQSHMEYLKDAGINAEEIVRTETTDACSDYIQYMSQAAREGTLAEGIFAAGPCNFSYYYLGLEIKRQMQEAGNWESNYFRNWLSYYINGEYKEGCDRYQALCDRVSQDLNDQEKDSIRTIFRKCSEFERDFWIMAGL